MNEKEPRIHHTAKEFFKFLNNYEGDSKINDRKAYDKHRNLIAIFVPPEKVVNC